MQQYNNAFAFTSRGVYQDHTLGHVPYCFCVHGRLTHKCSVFLHEPSIQPIFAHIYIMPYKFKCEEIQKYAYIQCWHCKAFYLNPITN